MKVISQLKTKTSSEDLKRAVEEDEDFKLFQNMRKSQFFLFAPRTILWPLNDLRCDIMVSNPGFFPEILQSAVELFNEQGWEGEEFNFDKLIKDKDIRARAPLFKTIGSTEAL